MTRPDLERLERLLLLTYGSYAVAYGALAVLLPCWRSGCENVFISHIRQSGATSLLSLGLLALLLLPRGLSRSTDLLWSFFLVNALMAILNLLTIGSAAAISWRWGCTALYALWAAGFAFCATRAADVLSGQGERPRWQRWLAMSLAAMKLLESAVWLVAPATFTARAGIVSPMAIYTGQIRGAGDVAFGLQLWLLRAPRSERLNQVSLFVFFVFNVALCLVGLEAQFTSIATPSRWPVEALQFVWLVGFGYAWMRTLSKGNARQQSI
jgi:hypothetical protein